MTDKKQQALDALEELNERFSIDTERQSGIYLRQIKEALQERQVDEDSNISELQDFACKISDLMWGGELGWDRPDGLNNLFNAVRDAKSLKEQMKTMILFGNEGYSPEFYEIIEKQRQPVDVEGLKKETVSYLLQKEVDHVTAKCMQGNFSFNKAQGEFEYYTKLIINRLQEQGYLNTPKQEDE